MSPDNSAKINNPVAGERSVKPNILLPRRGLSGLAIFAGALVLGIILFAVLESRRQSASSPAVTPQITPGTSLSSAPPPLDIPEEFPRGERFEPVFPERTNAPPPSPPPSFPSPPTPFVPPEPSSIVRQDPAPIARNSSGNVLVVDNSIAPPAAPEIVASSRAAGPSGNLDRVRAAKIANRATTVPQGTLIKAVLETALDSTNPGFARAIVSRNVHGFDGSRILIQRGSRLIGEYQADVSPGQKRALINWTRLIRPDGVTIEIGSPATDPLGRGGVRAKVNTHFFERFSAAIFQSALDIGVNVASRQTDGSVIINPSAARSSDVSQTNRITPTLKVKPGTSISIFVARDLDFTDVEAGR